MRPEGRWSPPFAILLANRGVRTFGYGLTGVLLGIYLTLLGGDRALVTASLGISLGSGALLNILAGYYADRGGRRRAMAVFGLLMAAAGALLALAPTLNVALLALLLGATSPTGTEVSPFLSVEQSIVAEVAGAGGRTKAFAIYNVVGSLSAAAGALASGIPTFLLGAAPTSPNPLRPMFAIYAFLGLVAAGLSLRLPSAVEIQGPREGVPLSPLSRSRVVRISSLFAIDSFAGGFVIQAFVSLWFFITYPESRAFLGQIFFAAGILAALSFLVAARIADRLGLLETMVSTHIPSNILLLLVALAPTFPLALSFYLARMALSQMDVPTRQAYLAGIVAREERTAANAATNTARNVAQAAGPVSAGALIAALGLSAPFFLGGGLKLLYDVGIFTAFRRVKPAEV